MEKYFKVMITKPFAEITQIHWSAACFANKVYPHATKLAATIRLETLPPQQSSQLLD